MFSLRIPFAEAAQEPKLLKSWVTRDLSTAQRSALFAAYGCPLDTSSRDASGFTELDYYWASQGFGQFDDLGRLEGVKHPMPYTPHEYRETWACWGIRAGKSTGLAATTVAYEAVCGGHEEHTRSGRPIVCFQIAQDLRFARYSLHSILAVLESMPLVRPRTDPRSMIKNVTADAIELKNGVDIRTCPPTVKSIRGYDSPVAVMDEVAVWANDADSANPDSAIYSQVSSRQAQFEFPKIVGISSPWSKAGLLWERFQAGTDGAKLMCEACRAYGVTFGCDKCAALRRPHKGRLVLYGTTSSLGNPLIRKSWLIAERDKNPRAFERECLALFQDSLSGFLPTALLQEAVDRGVLERLPQPLNFYVAAIDPAFRNDAFGFTICHADSATGAIVFDLVRQWKAGYGQQLDPVAVLQEITPLLKAYRIISVLSDQYQFEALSKLAMDQGWAIENFRFTGTSKQAIYGNLQQLVLQKRIRLLDHPATVNELSRLEAKLTDQHQMRIAAPEGEHDDLATVVALAASRAVWMLPEKAKPGPEGPVDQVKVKAAYEAAIEERCHAQARNKRSIREVITPDSVWD